MSALTIHAEALYVHVSLIIRVDLENPRASRHVSKLMPGLPSCRQSNIMVNCHKIVVRVPSARDPRSFLIRQGCREKSRIDCFTIDRLGFYSVDFSHICCVHEFLKWLMREQKIPHVVLVRVLNLLSLEPGDSVRANTVRTG